MPHLRLGVSHTAYKYVLILLVIGQVCHLVYLCIGLRKGPKIHYLSVLTAMPLLWSLSYSNHDPHLRLSVVLSAKVGSLHDCIVQIRKDEGSG